MKRLTLRQRFRPTAVAQIASYPFGRAYSAHSSADRGDSRRPLAGHNSSSTIART